MILCLLNTLRPILQQTIASVLTDLTTFHLDISLDITFISITCIIYNDFHAIFTFKRILTMISYFKTKYWKLCFSSATRQLYHYCNLTTGIRILIKH